MLVAGMRYIRHQTLFDKVHATNAKDEALAYPDYLKEFEIFTNALSRQLDAVVTQGKMTRCIFRQESCTLPYNLDQKTS